MKSKYDKVVDDMIAFLPFIRRAMVNSGLHIGILNSQYPIMGMVSKRGPMAMSDLGEKLGITKPNMTAIIDTLIKEKKVRRVYDSRDRRIINIEITNKGRETLEDNRKKLGEEFKNLFSYLDSREIESLANSLANIREIMSKINSKKGEK